MGVCIYMCVCVCVCVCIAASLYNQMMLFGPRRQLWDLLLQYPCYLLLLLSRFSRVQLCATPSGGAHQAATWQPTRLSCPWDSPGKNTGVGCHFLLQCMKVKSESEVAQSCPTLSNPMDCSLPGSSVHGIFQARGLEWGAIAFSMLFTEGETKTLIVPHVGGWLHKLIFPSSITSYPQKLLLLSRKPFSSWVSPGILATYNFSKYFHISPLILSLQQLHQKEEVMESAFGRLKQWG